jgi:O-acetylhomoserine (thiol)-lyase
VHGGWAGCPATGARTVPIYQTVGYSLQDAEYASNLFELRAPEYPGEIYSRFTNPTFEVLEKRMSALEGGVGAAALSSGQAATTFSNLTIANTGDNIVSSQTICGGTYTLFEMVFPQKFGIDVEFVDPSPENFAEAIDENTKAIFAESMGNPKLNMLDISEVAKVAHEAGIPLILDNTFGTPYLLKSFKHGVDIVMHSATKWIGNGTSVGGLVVDSGNFNWDNGKFPELTENDLAYRRNEGGLNYYKEFKELAYITKLKSRLNRDIGATMSPFNAYLFILGLETLSLRMERHCSNAMAVAEYLEEHPKVNWVIYPGLTSHPTHDLACKYLENGFGSMLGFGIKGGLKAGADFMKNIKIFSHLSTLGESNSIATHPASTTQSQLTPEQQVETGVTEDFIRLSIGIEDIDDIIEDLGQALAKI